MSLAFESLLAKEDAACCNSRRDALGRLPIGFCGDDCERKLRRYLVSEYVAKMQAPTTVSTYWSVRLDAYPGEWDPTADEWDDPTAEQALARVSS